MVISQYSIKQLTFVLWKGYFAGLTITQFSGNNVVCHWKIKPKNFKP